MQTKAPAVRWQIKMEKERVGILKAVKNTEAFAQDAEELKIADCATKKKNQNQASCVRDDT